MITSTLSHTKNYIRHHPIGLIILLIAFTQALHGALSTQYMPDFPAYTGAVKAWLNHQNPYLGAFPNLHGQVDFIYPPGSLWFFVPFHFISTNIGAALFTVGALSLFTLSLYLLLAKLFNHIPIDYRLICVALFIQTFPVKFNLTLGQINLYVVSFIVISMLNINKRPNLSAVALALSICIKPFALMILPLLFMENKYRLLLKTILIILILNIFTGPIFIYYLQHVLPSQLQSASVASPDLYNISINAIIFHLTRIPLTFNFGLLISLFITGYILFKSKSSLLIKSLSLLSISILIPANSWSHYWVYAYPLLITRYINPITLIPVWLLLAFHLPSPHSDNTFHALITATQNLTIYALIIFAIFKPSNIKSLQLHTPSSF